MQHFIQPQPEPFVSKPSAVLHSEKLRVTSIKRTHLQLDQHSALLQNQILLSCRIKKYIFQAFFYNFRLWFSEHPTIRPSENTCSKKSGGRQTPSDVILCLEFGRRGFSDLWVKCRWFKVIFVCHVKATHNATLSYII